MTYKESELENVLEISGSVKDKVHPWKICPSGQHYVRTHEERIPPSKTHPEGEIITRHEHCANNPSHKDLLSFDELQLISEKHFSGLSGSPTAGVLTDFPKADNYDELIRGWVRYWNDIFHLNDPLDPNLIKALMATESSFNANAENIIKSKNIHARGLLQITEGTLHILGDHHGELSNYLIDLTARDLFNPSSNICAGVRWLFRKKVTASAKLGREATWEETIIDYKGYWYDIEHGKTPDALIKLRKYYHQLQRK